MNAVTVEKLNAADRCDASCGAQARATVVFPGDSRLLFCGHHLRKYRASIEQRNDVCIFEEETDV